MQGPVTVTSHSSGAGPVRPPGGAVEPSPERQSGTPFRPQGASLPAGSGDDRHSPTGAFTDGDPSEPAPEAPREYAQQPFRLPPGATQVVLLRHGASAPYAPGATFPLVDGHGDPPLAPEGVAQAEKAAARLAAEPIAGLYVSTLCRTHQTAAPLAALLGLEPVVVPEVREVFLGDWEGGEFRVRIAEGHPIAMQMVQEERWDVIPNAESLEALGARVREGIAMVAAKHVGQTAVIVAHGGVIGEACHQATASRPFAFTQCENGSITRLVVHADGTWRLRTFNDVAHLA
jgi:probable phosphoglycerate mutase